MHEEFAGRMDTFRRRCAQLGMPVTHQRLVIYEALASTGLHPTPELVYEKVKRRIPSMSLATVYKNIHAFAAAGLLREVNLLHESVRLDANLGDHHHLVCTRCKSVTDIPASAISPVRMRSAPPGQFQVERFNVEVLGLCARCATASTGPKPPRRNNNG